MDLTQAEQDAVAPKASPPISSDIEMNVAKGSSGQEMAKESATTSKPSSLSSRPWWRFRTRIHLAFGVVGILALLSEGLIIYLLLTNEFNDTIHDLNIDQQEVLLFGAKKTLGDKVDGWLDLSKTIGASFQRRLNENPTMVLSDIWNPTFGADSGYLMDADANAITSAVLQQGLSVISIDRDGSNYKGDPSKPVDFNLSDTTLFADYSFFPCPIMFIRGEGNDTRYSRVCYDPQTRKAGDHIGYSTREDENGDQRRIAVEIDNEAIWDALKAAGGRYTFVWEYVPLGTITPLFFTAGRIYRLDDGRNITAQIGLTAEDLAQEVVGQMCSFKWAAGEFCESLLIEHTNFEILAWASGEDVENAKVGGGASDVRDTNSTSIEAVFTDLASRVNGSESFDDQYLGLETGSLLYSTERVFGDSATTWGDTGSLWITLIFDRDQINEEGDDVAKKAKLTMAATMVVAASVYVLMLCSYASRINNLRRTMRSIQTQPPEDSVQLVDEFVESTWIYEVYQIGKEFASVIRALAIANMEKRAVQEKQLAERAFLAHMAHDIRTPLHGILGTCEVVLERTKEAATQEYLRTVMHCGESLRRLLNDSIDLSRMQSNKMEIEVGRVHVAEVMQVIHSTFETQMVRSGRKLQMENPSGQDLYCIADLARLVQIATNLVSNAIKYSKLQNLTGGEGVVAGNPVYVCSHIWELSHQSSLLSKLLGDGASCIPGSKSTFHPTNVLTKQVGKPPIEGAPYVIISVTDFGRGIPNEKLVKLFSPFAQMRTQDSECGAGLGLNMCFHVAVLLEGFTGVISREGRGSIFYIAVPAAPTKSGYDKEEKEDSSTADETEAEEDADVEVVVDKDNDVVLVVDDTKVNRLILARHLETFGLQSVQACNGVEAVDMVREHDGRFRCVITDMEMPHMDGLTAASLMKKDYPDLPIICVSGNATAKDVQMAKEAGCAKLLAKPFCKDALKKALAMT